MPPCRCGVSSIWDRNLTHVRCHGALTGRAGVGEHGDAGRPLCSSARLSLGRSLSALCSSAGGVSHQPRTRRSHAAYEAFRSGGLPGVGSYFADDVRVGSARHTADRRHHPWPRRGPRAVGWNDGKAGRRRALCACAGSRRGRRGRLVLQASVLGAPDRERRDCPGVCGVLFEVREASMSGTAPMNAANENVAAKRLREWWASPPRSACNA